MATAPVLDLSTVADPRHVRIDGVLHTLRDPDALSLGQTTWMERNGPRLGELLQRADELTDEEDEEASTLLELAIRNVLDAPEEVKAKLTVVQRVHVLNAFTTLRSDKRRPAGASAPAARRRIGASTSRGSNGSTAATSRGGSGRSRSR